MSNLIILFLCFALGILLRATRRLPENAAAVLNAFIVNVSLPALAISLLHSVEMKSDMLVAASMPWVVFVLSGAIILVLAKVFHWSKAVTGCLILTAGLGNTSFVGFPLLEMFYGPDALKEGIVIDQGGSFLVLSTFGIMAASIYSSRDISPLAMLKRIVLFPPFIAAILGLASHGLAVPVVVMTALDRLGGTLVPLALFSVGFQLRFDKAALGRLQLPLGFGLTLKLLVVPAMIYAVYATAMAHGKLSFDILVLEAAMPPMITGAIIASDHDLAPELASLMVGIGIPFGIASVSLWHWLLS